MQYWFCGDVWTMILFVLPEEAALHLDVTSNISQRSSNSRLWRITGDTVSYEVERELLYILGKASIIFGRLVNQ